LDYNTLMGALEVSVFTIHNGASAILCITSLISGWLVVLLVVWFLIFHKLALA